MAFVNKQRMEGYVSSVFEEEYFYPVIGKPCKSHEITIFNSRISMVVINKEKQTKIVWHHKVYFNP